MIDWRCRFFGHKWAVHDYLPIGHRFKTEYRCSRRGCDFKRYEGDIEAVETTQVLGIKP